MFKQNALYLPAKAKPVVALAIIFVVLFSTQIEARSASISRASSDLIVFVRPQPLGSGSQNSDIWIMNADGSNETQLTTFIDADRWPALSPDGSKVAYVSYRNELWTLWVMNSDGTNPVQLPYAGNVQTPTWSSDGNQIAFAGDAEDGEEIWTINADGSNPQRLTTNSAAAGNPAWSPDGSKLVYTAEPIDDYSDLYTVNSDGTGQTLLVSAVISGFSNEVPSWSPDGSQIATIHSSAGNQGPYDLWVMDADGSNGQVLVQNIANPNVNNLAWSQDGHWLTFTNSSHIWTVKPDGSHLNEIANSGGWESDTNASSFSVPTSTPTPSTVPTPTVTPLPYTEHIVFVRPQPEAGADANVWIMNPDGSNETQLTTWNADDIAPVISPNGSKVAYYSLRNSSWTLWVMNSDGTNPVQLPVAGNVGGAPDWSPDGSQIAYGSDNQDWWEIWVVNADGTNPHRITTHGPAAGHPSWSPDGQKLAYGVEPSAKYLDLYTVNSNGTGQTLIVSASGSGFSNHQPAWSPDGTQIATIHWPAGNSSGPYDLWLMNTDGSNGHTLVQNIDSGTVNNLAWSRDSNWVLFAKGGQLWRIKRDGTGLTQITTTSGWQPDTNAQTFFNSKAIVYVWPTPSLTSSIDTNIWIMNPDGSNPTQLTTTTNPERVPAISPDGSKIVYQATIGNRCTMWVMNRDGTNPIQLQVNSTSSDCGSPAWSPNGQRLAFSSDAQDWWEIWVINADGTNPQRLTTSSGPPGSPSWSPDGTKLVFQESDSTASYWNLYTINSDGTGRTLLVSASATGFSNHQPAWSPTGTEIATVHWPAGGLAGPYDLWLMNADGSNGHVLVQNIDHPHINSVGWSTDGNWIVFGKGGQVWRVRRDGTGLTQITTTGGGEPDTNADTFSSSAATATATNTPTSTLTRTPTATSTRTNTPLPPTSTPTPTLLPFNANAIVFVRPQPELGLDSNIWIMNADGSNQTQLTTWNGEDRWPALSPDGSKIAYVSVHNNQWQLWLMNSDGTNATQLPVSGNTQRLAWSPDSQKIALTNDSVDWWEVWVINADGTNLHRLTTTGPAAGVSGWSPDGQKLLYGVNPSTGYNDLYTINSDGTGSTLLVSASGTGFSNVLAAWSPDGTQIITGRSPAGSTTGPYDLWLMNADGSNGHLILSNLTALNLNRLSWSADGNWLVFSKGGQVWRVQKNGNNPIQITNNSGWEPDTNANTFSSSLNLNLMAYWQLEEAAGLRVDATGRGNNLSDHNGVGQRTGKIGNAAQFTPTNNTYLSVADTPDLSTGDIDFTLSAWVYLTDKGNAYQVIAGKGTSATFAGQEYELFYTYNVGTNDRFGFFVQNGADQGLVYANQFGAPALNTWYFIAAWHDAGANTVNIQINNGPVDSAAWSGGSQDTAQEFTLGKIATDPGFYWSGGIDEVGFWKRTLTASERTTLYNCGSGLTYPFTAPLSPCPTSTPTPSRTPTPTPLPGGEAIVFVRPPPSLNPSDTNIWIMNPDGSNPVQLTTSTNPERVPAISPNGSKIVYQAVINNQCTSWVVNRDGTNPIQLQVPGSSGNCGGPAWSPNGQQIAFSSDAISFWEIWVVNADGTNPQRLTDNAGEAGSPSWSPNGLKIVYQSEPSAKYLDLYTINTDGTGQTLLVSASGTGFSNHQPAWSPDGTQIATIHWTAGSSVGPYDLWLMNADGSNGHVIVPNIDHYDTNKLAWSKDSNWIVFNKGGQIWRVRRDGTGLTQITTTGGGEPHTNADTFSSSAPTATPTNTPTRTNTPLPPTSTPTPTPLPFNANAIVFVRPQPGVGLDSNVWIMNADGSNQTQLTTWNGEDLWPALSPDGSKITYVSIRNNQQTLWVMNSNGSNPTQLPFTGNVQSPTWSPDGSQITFQGDSVDWWEIWALNADGSNPRRLTTHAGASGAPDWSPDGQKILYTNESSTMVHDLYTVNSNGTGQSLLLSASATGFSNHRPAWSPDGTKIATIHYPAGSVGPYDLWLMNANGSNGQVLVQGIDSPNVNHLAWSPDGNSLIFAKGGQVWRVQINGSNPLQITTNGGWAPDISSGLFVNPRPTATLTSTLTPTRTPTPTATQPTCAAPPSGMVSWWSGEGNANDRMGANPGTLQNGVTFAAGRVNQAFQFDGTASYVRVPDNASLRPVNAMTVDAWIKPEAPLYTYAPIFKKSGVGQSNGYALEFNGSNVNFWIYTTGGWWVASPSLSVPLGQWSHVAGVYNGATVGLYVNGSLVGSPTSAPGGILASTEELNIGRDPSNPTTRFYHGLIDEVEFFNRALSASEIQAIYSAGGAGHCPVTPTPTPTPLPANGNSIVFVWPQAQLDPWNTDTNIWIMNWDGSNRTQLTTSTVPERVPALSPNGSKIAYSAFINNRCTLWVMNRNGTNPTQLQVNNTSNDCGSPTWSPNGQQLAFSSDAVGWWEIWVINADGSNPHKLTTHDWAAGEPSWSPNGQKLVYAVNPVAVGYEDIYTVNSDGTGQTLLVSSGSGFSNHRPAWSPNGTEIATIHWPAGADGPYDLWLMNANGTNGHVLVQNIDHPHTNRLSWSPDGNWLVFGKNGQIWRVKRDGTGLTQITTTGGWEPYVGAGGLSLTPRIYLPLVINNSCDLLYADDFSNSASGWFVGDSGSSLWQYLSGEYRMLVRDTDWGASAATSAKFSNYVAAVDVRNASGSFGTYGLVFGLSDNWSQFYALLVDPDGIYSIWRYDPSGGWTLLTWGTSDAINQGTATNRLKVERNGSLIKASINDQLITMGTDGTYTGLRRLGLIVNSYDESNVDIRFDNFKVYPPVCGSMSGLSESGQLSIGTSSFGAGQTDQGASRLEGPNRLPAVLPQRSAATGWKR